jgi:TolB-like protein/Tfp pilus assembly protein PilF
MADALISRLSRSSNFSVRPTNSVLQYQGVDFDPAKVGEELHVDHLLVGNIKRVEEKTRVTVQLLDLKTNSAVWAASISETGPDLLFLEDTLAGKVVDALIPHLSGHDREELAKRGTNVPKAFEHYLRGRYYFNSFNEDGLARAFVSFHNAIAADPDYAAAYSGIADYYAWLGIIGVLPPQECFQPAIAAASKAVELDPQLSDPYASLGFSLHAGNFDWSGGEQNLRHAIELNNSNATAFAWLAIVLITQGRFDEGLSAARRAVELDPVTPFKHHNVAWNLYFARRFEEAADHYENVVRAFPDYSFGHYGLSKVYRRLGRNDRALKEAMLADQTMGDSIFAKFGLAESLAANGRGDDARGVLQSLIDLSETRYISPYHQALVHCCLAENERGHARKESIETAFACLREALSIKDAWLNWMGVEPTFDILRNDARFDEMLEKAGYDTFGYNYKAAAIEAEKVTTKENLFERTTMIDDSSTTQGFIPAILKKNFAIPAALVVIAAIGISFLYFTGYLTRNETPVSTGVLSSATAAKRIVILPFTGGDPNATTMGSGIADALSQKLGSIKALEIVSANSGRTMASKTDAEIRTVLRANYALRGTITIGERSAAVDAMFVDLASGTTLWSGVFDAPDGDLFKLQTVLAEKIWTSLGVEPLPLERQMVERIYTQNAEAYQLYLIGRFQLTNRSSSDIRKAIVSFSESIKIDPAFAPAYVGLADAYSLLNLYSVEPPPDAYKLAGEYASKALAIDPDLAEAHASLGYVKFYYERDREAAELEFRRAIQLNPSYAQAHHWFALALAGMGDPLKALEEIRIAQWLDPGSLAIKAAAGMVLFFNGKYTEALNECDAALAVDQNFIPAIKVKRWIYTAQNDRAAAKSTFAKEIAYSGGEADNPGWQIVQAQVEDPLYLPTLKKASLSNEIQGRPFAYAFETALAFMALGDNEGAVKFLETAERSRSHGFNFAAVDPRLQELRKDARVQRLLAKLNPRKQSY